MGVLVNIDSSDTAANMAARERVVHTKFPAAPHKLAQTFIEALTCASRELYGEENLAGFLLQQGTSEADIRVHVELELRHGKQSVRAGIVSPFRQPQSASHLIELLNVFCHHFAWPFTEDNQAPEDELHIELIRVMSYVENLRLDMLSRLQADGEVPAPRAARACKFAMADGGLTRICRHTEMEEGMTVDGPALVESPHTTYLVEPGWTLTMGHLGSGCLKQMEADPADGPTPSHPVMLAAG